MLWANAFFWLKEERIISELTPCSPHLWGKSSMKKLNIIQLCEQRSESTLHFWQPPKMCYGRNRWNSTEVQNNWLDKSPISFNFFAPYWKVLNLVYQVRSVKEKTPLCTRCQATFPLIKKSFTLTLLVRIEAWQDWLETLMKHRA